MKMIDMDFYRLIRHIIKTEEFKSMKNFRHHVKGNVHDHCIRVAYFCYNHHKRFKLSIPIEEFVRGALLHDYYLYDWHTGKVKHHGREHPKIALENALKKYPDLTSNEIDMIENHMFPLTLLHPPKTKWGWLICFYDKVAAVCDYCGKNKWKKQIFK